MKSYIKNFFKDGPKEDNHWEYNAKGLKLHETLEQQTQRVHIQYTIGKNFMEQAKPMLAWMYFDYLKTHNYLMIDNKFTEFLTDLFNNIIHIEDTEGHRISFYLSNNWRQSTINSKSEISIKVQETIKADVYGRFVNTLNMWYNFFYAELACMIRDDYSEDDLLKTFLYWMILLKKSIMLNIYTLASERDVPLERDVDNWVNEEICNGMYQEVKKSSSTEHNWEELLTNLLTDLSGQSYWK